MTPSQATSLARCCARRRRCCSAPRRSPMRSSPIRRRSPSRWSCRSRPAAATTSWRAPSARGWREILGQAVIVDNQPGAGGNLGTDIVARAPADGYTMLLASNQVTINPAIGVKTPFKLEKDFAPVSLLASVPIVLVANRPSPTRRCSEFVQYAKANSGKLSYSSPGNGTPQHLAGEVFANLAKTAAGACALPRHRPGHRRRDRRTGAAGSFGTMASVLPFIESGKLRALGIAGQQARPR